MALDYTVNSLDGVDDAVKSLYVEKDGSFILDISGIDTGEELKGALDKERDARRKLEREVKRNGDLKAEEERKALETKEEFKTLYDTALAENQVLKQNQLDNKKLSFADSIVSGLTTDTKRAGVLKKQVLDNLSFDDDGEVQISGIAGVTKSSEFVSHLRKEYDFLVDGSKASGGGSAGGGGKPEGKSKTIEQFQQLNGHERMKFVRNGGLVTAE